MKKLGITSIALGVTAAAALGVPALAAAAPTGGSPAGDTIEWLRDNGYHVQLNGKPNGPLSQCVATGVHGMRGSGVDSQSGSTTVYVDISCNNAT